MVRLRVLGALDLRGADGQQLRGVLTQPKRAALFAYLALATPRGSCRRDTLLALFWPEQDAERARNALSQSVHFLRRALGADALVSGNADALSVDWSDLWCDAIAFEEALDSGRVAEALELYRGELLEGFHIANAPDFERWLEAERSRLGGRFVRAVEQAAAESERAGDFAGAVAHWHRLAARDPYSSRTALGLMRALAAAGDPAGAVRHARVHETLLRDELGVAPHAEIAALVQGLRAAPSERQGPSAHMASKRPSPARDALDPVSAARPAEDSAGRSERGDPEPTAVVGAASLRGSSHRRRRRTAVLTGGFLAACAIAGALVIGQRGLSASVPPIRSIAVMPFVNLSGSSADQYFADAMHDALVTELSRYPGLGVTPRTTVQQYRGGAKRLSEIARELKVDGVVEATLLREGGRVRLNAQLAHGDVTVWGQTYNRELRDTLELQAELAAAIAREVHAAVRPGQSRRAERGIRDSVPRDMRLRELYVRGRSLEVSRSFDNMITAAQYYRRAIDEDSSFALAYAALAENYALQAHYDFAPKGPALDSARMMAQHAVLLDSTLAEGHTALGISLSHDRKFAEAEREFRRAIALNDSNASARYWYAMLLVTLGRGADALEQATIAWTLDSLGPRAVLSTKRDAEFLIRGDRPYKSKPVRTRRQILQVESGEPWARARDAVEFAEEGNCSEARKDIGRAQRIVPEANRVMLGFTGMVDWLCGDSAKARATLAGLKQGPDADDHALRAALLHQKFGETDSAFVWLGRHRWTISELTMLSGGQLLDPLRSDPRLAQLMLQLGMRERSQGLTAPGDTSASRSAQRSP